MPHSNRDQRGPTLGEIRATVARLAAGGIVPIHETARALHTSTRSLQRCLSGQGARYSEVSEAVRFELAVVLLRDTMLSMKTIAERLGYRDASSFSRAFGRWAGCTPRQYRRASRGRES